MVHSIKRTSSTSFDSRDLAVCQQVFDDIRSGAGIAKESEEAERMAAITVELYRQGVREPSHLKTMVESARGLFRRQEISPNSAKQQ
ncbi:MULTISPECIES: hypothetical protein [unclassified Rhizobium]|uniref:hypothetical protein n=1 Tax=unclassified Rhizobium TaxID=2613769 RepID=UPI0038259251